MICLIYTSIHIYIHTYIMLSRTAGADHVTVVVILIQVVVILIQVSISARQGVCEPLHGCPQPSLVCAWGVSGMCVVTAGGG